MSNKHTLGAVLALACLLAACGPTPEEQQRATKVLLGFPPDEPGNVCELDTVRVVCDDRGNVIELDLSSQQLLNFDKIMFTELIKCHNRGMRPYGTSEQLKKRREEAQQLLKGGVSVDAVAAQMGVNPQSVRRWRREQKHPKEKSERAPGRAAYLTEKQIKKLEKELLRGAYAHGYSEDYWTLDRIGHVIWTLFGVRYEPSGVWRLMTRIGWSSQKVQRLAIQRDDAEIANWKRWVWPRIKKVA